MSFIKLAFPTSCFSFYTEGASVLSQLIARHDSAQVQTRCTLPQQRQLLGQGLTMQFPRQLYGHYALRRGQTAECGDCCGREMRAERGEGGGEAQVAGCKRARQQDGRQYYEGKAEQVMQGKAEQNMQCKAASKHICRARAGGQGCAQSRGHLLQADPPMAKLRTQFHWEQEG